MKRILPYVIATLAMTPVFACSTSNPSTSGSAGMGGHGGHGGSAASTGGHGPASSSSSGGSGGAGGADGRGPPAWNRMVTPPTDADAETQRAACGYKAGSLPAETQGASYPSGDAIPIKHILLLMKENRSFDHYFSQLPAYGQPDVEVFPASYTNPDGMGGTVAPYHDKEFCLVDTNHEWAGSHQEYDSGMMDGFFQANQGWGTPPMNPLADSMSGARALAWYDSTDIPFYYWLASTFSVADHYHCSLLGPTWPNRMYFYAASSRGATTNSSPDFHDQAGACMTDADCGGAAGSCVNEDGNGSCKGTCKVDADCGVDAQAGACDVAGGGACKTVGRTIFDYMEQRHLDWKVYASSTPGFAVMLSTFVNYLSHVHTIAEYYCDAAAGTLPDVAFIDPDITDETYQGNDDHPPGTPQHGELFTANVIDALTKSPAWSSSALFLNWDEHGGYFDHVAPPPACKPDAIPPSLSTGDPPGDFDTYGVRVPLIVVSPYAKKHHVSHAVYDHTSVLRFVEARFVIPAITNRDANALAPWDMFDFGAAAFGTPPKVPLPPDDPAVISACGQVWGSAPAVPDPTPGTCP